MHVYFVITKLIQLVIEATKWRASAWLQIKSTFLRQRLKRFTRDFELVLPWSLESRAENHSSSDERRSQRGREKKNIILLILKIYFSFLRFLVVEKR